MDSARRFEYDVLRVAIDDLRDGFRRHIVEQQKIASEFDRTVRSGLTLYFDLDGQALGRVLNRADNGEVETARRRDVIILDEECVVEADSMIQSAAYSHRVFFKQTPAGGRLPGVDQFD